MSTKKIVSSLAQYKDGQLTCILCKVPVKNELYWTGHINGRVHRNNIQLLKRKAEAEKTAEPPAGAKKIKVDDGVKAPTKPAPVPKDVEERIIFKPKTSSGQAHPTVDKASVNDTRTGPTTVEFEDGEDGAAEVKESSESGGRKAEPKSDLPEGFFDDPKLDAKIRGVEYVDPEEAEWQKFLKEIASEELQSENIQDYDEEESRKERELDEIEDMMVHWQKVIDLEKKKDSRVKKMETKVEDSGSSGDEEEFNEELNWRVKKF